MRNKIVAGNWKMNLSRQEAMELYQALGEISGHSCEVQVYVSSIYLDPLIQQQHAVGIGAQNFYPLEKGAYTGEVSIWQLQQMGVKRVLVGHSERRELFQENNEIIRQKVDAALAHGMQVMYCCGEPLNIREQGKELHYVYKQFEANLFHLTAEQMGRITIAYEPIWAIGTGKTATTEQAQDMHRNLRLALRDQFGDAIADQTPILYGGSCNANNASELFACPDIDGGLIGGASLRAEEFKTIINARG